MVTLEPLKSKRFHLHSIAVELRGPGSGRLAKDFDYFLDRPNPKGQERYSVTLELLARAPEKRDLPAKMADRIFPDCVLYRDESRLTYEYNGGAVLIVERVANASIGQLYSENETLAQEIGYLYLQSEIGRFLDAQGLHRVHALGIGLPDGKAALVLLPSGGGKSTMAAEIVKSGKCVLLSDDTPLVDRFGRVHPYPLRLSFRADAEMPEKWRASSSEFHRRKYGKKILVPIGALPSEALPRPGERFLPGYLIIGRRHGQRDIPELKRLPRWRSAVPILRDLVVGLGVPQVAELILTEGAMSLPGLAPTAASRMAAASAYLARSQSFALDLARDPQANAQLLIQELTQNRGRA